MRQGPFDEEEDEYIIRRLIIAYDNRDLCHTVSSTSSTNTTDLGEGGLPRGIWISIAVDLNRDLKCVYAHWRQILSKKYAHLRPVTSHEVKLIEDFLERS